ncbi:hypothetical protein CEXT_278971 [Caerostris extrusa]|uniref:Uncharacterized protein n=1 Tax=Caerostris extrusa TaxID=172846 RepID=A0AAV4XBR7_CAEEX|nr:hypothetical protein CEXT_278971 [Caerostris extrusa]
MADSSDVYGQLKKDPKCEVITSLMTAYLGCDGLVYALDELLDAGEERAADWSTPVNKPRTRSQVNGLFTSKKSDG